MTETVSCWHDKHCDENGAEPGGTTARNALERVVRRFDVQIMCGVLSSLAQLTQFASPTCRTDSKPVDDLCPTR